MIAAAALGALAMVACAVGCDGDHAPGAKLVGFAAATGALGGALGWLALRARAALRRERKSPGAVASVLLAATAQAIAFVHALASEPDVFAAEWYGRGGARRALMVVATDVLGARGAWLLAVIGLASFVGPSGLRGAVHAARPLVRRLPRPALALALVLGCCGDVRGRSGADKAVLFVLERADGLGADTAPTIAALGRAESVLAVDPSRAWGRIRVASARGRADEALSAQPLLAPWLRTPLGRAFFGNGVGPASDDAVVEAALEAFDAQAAGQEVIAVRIPVRWDDRFADRSYRGPYKYGDGPGPAKTARDEAQLRALAAGAMARADAIVLRVLRALTERGGGRCVAVTAAPRSRASATPLVLRGVAHGPAEWRDLDVVPALRACLGVAPPAPPAPARADPRAVLLLEAPDAFVRTVGARGVLFEAAYASADGLSAMARGVAADEPDAGVAELLAAAGVALHRERAASSDAAEAIVRARGEGAIVVALAPRPGGAPPWTTTSMALAWPDAPRAVVGAAVRDVDVAPTVLSLLGLEPPSRLRGASLLPLARGEAEPPRPVLLRDARGGAFVHDGRVLVIGSREAAFALASGARLGPDVVAELHARLEAATLGVPVVGEPERCSMARVALRFTGAGRSRRVVATLWADGARLRAHAFGASEEAIRETEGRVELAMTTDPDAAVGVDLELFPADAPLRWELWLDDAPWPEHAVFLGPRRLASPNARDALATTEARRAATSRALPHVDPARDLGAFVVRRYSMECSESLL